MCTEEEWAETQNVNGKYKLLYAHVEDFCFLFERVERDGVCLGFRRRGRRKAPLEWWRRQCRKLQMQLLYH